MDIAMVPKNKPVTSGGVAQGGKRAAVVHVPQPTAATAAAAAARHSVIAAAAGVYTVTLLLPGGKEAVFRAGNSKSIYDIASYAGVHLPASCKQGTCTACCAKLLSGRVSQPQQKCIPPALLKQGYVALCCATPTSDVRLQTHQGPTIKKWKAEQANM